MPEFRLPLPPSNNTLVRPCLMRGRENGKPMIRLVSTRESDQFRKVAHALLPVAPMGGPLEVYLTVYVPTLASDGGNRLKALEDACNGRIWFDDKQIAEWHIIKVVTGDANFTGVNLRVEPANPIEHPELSARLAKSSIAEREVELAQSKLNLPAPVVPRAVLPEPLREKLERLAKPASYPPGSDDHLGGAA